MARRPGIATDLEELDDVVQESGRDRFDHGHGCRGMQRKRSYVAEREHARRIGSWPVGRASRVGERRRVRL
jgi:hypothetical protein